MTLEMPTPESLEAEAAELVTLAVKKEVRSEHPCCSDRSRDALLSDAATFREEAQAKRAKAQRLIRKDIEAGLRTPSGTPVSTIERMEEQGQKVWESHLKDIGSVPWDSK